MGLSRPIFLIGISRWKTGVIMDNNFLKASLASIIFFGLISVTLTYSGLVRLELGLEDPFNRTAKEISFEKKLRDIKIELREVKVEQVLVRRMANINLKSKEADDLASLVRAIESDDERAINGSIKKLRENNSVLDVDYLVNELYATGLISEGF